MIGSTSFVFGRTFPIPQVTFVPTLFFINCQDVETLFPGIFALVGLSLRKERIKTLWYCSLRF